MVVLEMVVLSYSCCSGRNCQDEYVWGDNGFGERCFLSLTH